MFERLELCPRTILKSGETNTYVWKVSGHNMLLPPPLDNNWSINIRNIPSNATNSIIPCVSEPFERNNVARAVHEKIKFDTIKAQFVEVHASPDNCAPFLFSFFLQATVGQP